jgi:formyl-CoA transferase/CoA:oxalate CoA-transferase
MGTRHPSIVPYECFEVKDGFVNVAVTNQKQWTNFCRVLGFPEIASDPRFEKMESRLSHYDELKEMIDRVLSKMSKSEVMLKMSQVGIPAGPVHSVGDIMEDPQIHAREMVKELTHPEYGPLRVLGIPIKLSDTPGGVETAPPRFGEHNAEILAAMGYSDSEIARLTAAGVVSAM